MTGSNTSGLNRALEAVGKCARQANYPEWRDKMRQVIALLTPELLAVLDGVLCPTAVGLNPADVAA